MKSVIKETYMINQIQKWLILAKPPENMSSGDKPGCTDTGFKFRI